jgi:uncharacterized protein (TIGR00369 family)
MTEDLVYPLPGATNVHDALGIVVTSVTPERVILEVEVGPQLHQPYGIVHGGVYALLAEGAASIGGSVSVEEGYVVVGTELNCSHLRAVTRGALRATATPIRKGRTVQVWSVEVTDDNNRVVSVARCSLQVVKAPPSA